MHALGFRLLLTFSSSIGQTYFIALFAGALRADLGLSHGAFGGLYTLATLGSALTLVWLGKTADRVDPTTLAALTLAALAGFALVLAGAETALWLGLGLFGLRLFGQGMSSHLSMTFVARAFIRERGRALGLAFLGYPAGEALFPLLMALLLGLFTWRWIWVGIAAAVVLIGIPVVFWVGAGLRRHGLTTISAQAPSAERPQDRSWTRAEVLRDARFYVLLPGVMTSPFVITGVLFHQVHLVEVKGWTLPAFAACYPLWAELYGTAHLGAIRALSAALQVLATALAPATLGWLIDQGVALDRQATLLSLLVGTSAAGLAVLLPSLLRYHAPPA